MSSTDSTLDDYKTFLAIIPNLSEYTSNRKTLACILLTILSIFCGIHIGFICCFYSHYGLFKANLAASACYAILISLSESFLLNRRLPAHKKLFLACMYWWLYTISLVIGSISTYYFATCFLALLNILLSCIVVILNYVVYHIEQLFNWLDSLK